jgi:3-phosphoglycerate kinase
MECRHSCHSREHVHGQPADAQRGDKGAYVVAGGGETVEMIRSLHANKSFSLVSTGGGAMLEFLSGEKLPGIQALEFSALNDTACL